MVHFNKKSITLDYLAIFQMFLILLKLNNKITWSWIVVFLPYVLATLITIVGGVILALFIEITDEDYLK